VKARSLAEEARIIRQFENRTPWFSEQTLLRDHRKGTVRRVARETNLAIAFLRGHPYRRVEAKGDPSGVNWAAVRKMVETYGANHWFGRGKEGGREAGAAQLKVFDTWWKE
jgi:hypothetical protein